MLAESSDTLTLWEGLSLLAIDPVTSSGMFIEGLTLELSGGEAVRLERVVRCHEPAPPHPKLHLLHLPRDQRPAVALAKVA